VGELANHLPAGAVLYQEGIFPAYLGAPGDVGKLHEQRCRAAANGGHAAVHDAIFRLHLVRAEVQLIGVVVSGYADAGQDIVEFRVVVEEPQQRFAARAPLAHAEDILCGGVEAEDEQVSVQQDDAGAQAVEDVLCLLANVAVD
jgi:hypothetical protein